MAKHKYDLEESKDEVTKLRRVIEEITHDVLIFNSKPVTNSIQVRKFIQKESLCGYKLKRKKKIAVPTSCA